MERTPSDNLNNRFYHSFPRRAKEDSVAQGLAILQSILETGLLLVPELNEFPGELDEDTGQVGSPLRAFRRRFCLTQLSAAEVGGHGAVFGNFHLAFTWQVVRLLGAIPVIYIPQPLGVGQHDLGLLGNTLVHRMFEIQQLLEDLDNLNQSIAANRECSQIELNVADRKRVFRTEDLSWLLSSLTDRRQPLAVLAAVTKVMSAFFHPTEYYAEEKGSWGAGRLGAAKGLSYYKQREWRIVGDIVLKQEKLDRKLLDTESRRLLSFDGEFFGRQMEFPSGKWRLVDKCTTIEAVGGKHVRFLIDAIIVPNEALERAAQLAQQFGLVGDAVTTIDELTRRAQ